MQRIADAKKQAIVLPLNATTSAAKIITTRVWIHEAAPSGEGWQHLVVLARGCGVEKGRAAPGRSRTRDRQSRQTEGTPPQLTDWSEHTRRSQLSPSRMETHYRKEQLLHVVHVMLGEM